MPNTVTDGLFFGGGVAQLVPQLIGVAAAGIMTFAAGAVAWLLIRAAFGLRVSEEEEIGGLDFGEHGNRAYPDFQIATSSEGMLSHGGSR